MHAGTEIESKFYFLANSDVMSTQGLFAFFDRALQPILANLHVAFRYLMLEFNLLRRIAFVLSLWPSRDTSESAVVRMASRRRWNH
jgi:hypothetical protein